MQLRNGKHMLDAYRPTFDPHLDIATVVFSHVQCVKTRVNLAVVSKLWRDASKPAAAYPLRFDFDAFPDSGLIVTRLQRHLYACWTTTKLCLCPTRESSDFLVKLRTTYATTLLCRGSVRLLKWTRENNLDWSVMTCHIAAIKGHLPALQYLHENGCPWDSGTRALAQPEMEHCPLSSTCTRTGALGTGTRATTPPYKRWDCLQYAVDNKCHEVGDIRQGHARAPPMK